MDTNTMNTLSKLIASRVNEIINLPFLSEAQEQKLFEMVIEEAIIILSYLLKKNKERIGENENIGMPELAE